MYKMIFVDLDGTLLNDYKEISKENIESIQRAYDEKGIITVIATGRPLVYVNELFNLYSDCFANYIIACDGAIIENSKTNQYIHKVTFTNEEVLKIRDIFLEENTNYMMLYTDKQELIEMRNGKELESLGMSANQKNINIENIIKDESNLLNLVCLISADTCILEKIIKKINKLDDIELPIICDYSYKTK